MESYISRELIEEFAQNDGVFGAPWFGAALVVNFDYAALTIEKAFSGSL
jgi:hypothetical protein